MRNADECSGVSGVEISIEKTVQWLQELVMMISEDGYFRI